MVETANTNTRIRTTERDIHVLEAVRRYSIGTKQTIRQLPCFEGAAKHAAVEGALKRDH